MEYGTPRPTFLRHAGIAGGVADIVGTKLSEVNRSAELIRPRPRDVEQLADWEF